MNNSSKLVGYSMYQDGEKNYLKKRNVGSFLIFIWTQELLFDNLLFQNDLPCC